MKRLLIVRSLVCVSLSLAFSVYAGDDSLFNSLPGRWWCSCFRDIGKVEPRNPCEIQITNGVFEFRTWSGLDDSWGFWPTEYGSWATKDRVGQWRWDPNQNLIVPFSTRGDWLKWRLK